MSFSAKGKTFTDINNITKHEVGILLGTGKFTANGKVNSYYTHRLNAAVNLYKLGKINRILVSGDNSRRGYDEPSDFKNDLIALGIPEHHIYLDFAGFRTLDSIIRAKEVFNVNKAIIISQKFHNQRAIYLASQYDLNFIGFNAQNVSNSYGLKTEFREYLARTKAVFDIIFNVQPKFKGPKVIIK
ncbi:protein SanA [Patiriisocius marinistellae]|uniref:Protein SanA n=1 Tax=Patiriisocius marinistellae TaxID=2494560 RepID=A0A5J4G382_9FLAO|nr:protein SanA [Patiriisocius marinistellae]